MTSSHKRLRNILFVLLLATYAFSMPEPALAWCATTANPCESLSDCVDPFPWPCDSECVHLCGTYTQSMECVSNVCYCICDTIQ